MGYCKRFFILFFILILLCGYCFASEDVSSNVVSNLSMDATSNFFYSDTSHVIRYAEIEKGYIYHFTNTTNFNIGIAFSNDVPSVNVPYYDFKFVEPNGSYSFISNNYSYAYFNDRDANMVLTREPIQNQDSAIVGLVDNVGPNAFWGVFGSSLDFVFIIVIVAFGLFIIYKLIKGLSKGKSKI